MAVGGTFDVLHLGHRKLIQRALELAGDGEVVIGLTSDSFSRDASPFEVRRRNLERYLRDLGGKFTIVEIDDIYGPTLTEHFDAIVVSSETRRNAEKINAERIRRGLPPMRIFEIDMVMAEDGKPISSTRIKRGEIDEMGRIK